MRVRIALTLLFGFLVAPLTAAETPNFSSAEMIKGRIDAAMPGIQKRDTEVLQKLFLDFAPAETVAEMMPKYGPLFKVEMLPSEAGWSYLGAKTVGSIYRQFVYVCRYDRAFIVWRFAAVEKEGRWSLLNVAVGTTADDLLEDKAAGDEQCIPFCEKIATMVGRGDQEVAQAVMQRWVAHEKSIEPVQETAWRKMAALAILAGGTPLKCELIGSRGMGEIWAQYQYLIRWKDGMLTLTFNFYHVGDEWQLIGITPAGDNNALFSHAEWDPQTRQAARPQDTRLK